MYKGVVADVSITGNFLGGQTQVNQVFLVSLSLASSANNLVGNLPSGVEVLALANDRLTAFPTPITEFKSLKRLYVHPAASWAGCADSAQCADGVHHTPWTGSSSSTTSLRCRRATASTL